MAQAATPQVVHIAQLILPIRGQKVILDADLAALYGVETKRLNEQVRRNKERFPEDFMFQLTKEEFSNLKSQFATSRHGGRRKLPLVFTEHGALMAASVLNTETAIKVSVEVVRGFVRLRKILATNRQLARKIEAMEKKYDKNFKAVFQALQLLMIEEQKPKRKIGFQLDPDHEEG